MKRYAIVGFGGAGYNAAREIRRRDPEALIDVWSDTDIGPYNPMLTTYYVKGAIPYESMFPFGSLEEIEKELKIRYHAKSPVTGLVPEEKKLCFADGREERYDAILISTGASAVMPPLPGIDLPGVFKMRTAYDAAELKEKLDRGEIHDALVIGSSWVGIKVLEDLVERGVECTLVDGADWVFFVALFKETADRVQKDLEDRGIKVSCGQMLSSIEKEADGRLTAVMKNGNRFTADTVAVCIGVRMNVKFLLESGLKINRGVVVDNHMRTNYEGIYAAGDCCEAIDIQSGQPRNIGVWLNANRQGQIAGANMAGGREEFDANVLVNLAHYLNYDFISMGDVSSCKPEDEVYEYEDERYYIRAVKGTNGDFKCINIIGSGDSNGIAKNIFIKYFENKEAEMDVRTICYLQDRKFPDSFIKFMGGKLH